MPPPRPDGPAKPLLILHRVITMLSLYNHSIWHPLHPRSRPCACLVFSLVTHLSTNTAQGCLPRVTAVARYIVTSVTNTFLPSQKTKTVSMFFKCVYMNWRHKQLSKGFISNYGRIKYCTTLVVAETLHSLHMVNICKLHEHIYGVYQSPFACLTSNRQR